MTWILSVSLTGGNKWSLAGLAGKGYHHDCVLVWLRVFN